MDNDSWTTGVTPYSPTKQASESAAPVDQSGSANVATVASVANNDILNNATPRVTQQIIIPTAVKSRSLGDLFTNQPADPNEAFFGNFALPDSSSVSFLFTVADPQGREIFVSPYISFFITGSLEDFPVPTDQWPNQSFGMGNMPVSVFNDIGLTDGIANSVTRAIIRNNTGNTQAVWCYGRFRIIANPSQTTGTV